jgi:hypothetical protein
MVAGWLIAAFTMLFGAPFWFDTLQQFVRIKGSAQVLWKSRTRPAQSPRLTA